MATYGVTIRNMPQIREAFVKHPADMVRELDKAIKKSIFSIQGDSMRNSPVDTGFLRASHQTAFQPLKGVLQPMASYAVYVHEGTRYQAAQPFMAEAINSNEDRVNRFFIAAVNNTLNRLGESA